MGRKRKAAENKVQPIRCTTFWSDRELIDLAYGIQEHGFAETKKIAEGIKTKDENEVKQYLTVEANKLRQKDTTRQAGRRLKSSWNSPDSSDLANWSNLRKWRRVIHDQHLPCVKKQDYSKILLEDLFRTFYEEAEDSDDPEVINVKPIYKYLLDCIRGFVPAELTPIDSGVVLIMLGQLVEMHRDLDFNEEKNFLRNFKKARAFAPIKVKEEFREKTKKRSAGVKNATQTSKMDHCEEVPETSSNDSGSVKTIKVEKQDADNDTIRVVEEMYYNLSRHRKIVQSFNPLNVPLWNIVKEQNYVQHKCDQASKRARHQYPSTISKK